MRNELFQNPMPASCRALHKVNPRAFIRHDSTLQATKKNFYPVEIILNLLLSNGFLW
jgi:hypothetical protein